MSLPVVCRVRANRTATMIAGITVQTTSIVVLPRVWLGVRSGRSRYLTRTQASNDQTVISTALSMANIV